MVYINIKWDICIFIMVFHMVYIMVYIIIVGYYTNNK